MKSTTSRQKSRTLAALKKECRTPGSVTPAREVEVLEQRMLLTGIGGGLNKVAVRFIDGDGDTVTVRIGGGVTRARFDIMLVGGAQNDADIQSITIHNAVVNRTGLSILVQPRRIINGTVGVAGSVFTPGVTDVQLITDAPGALGSTGLKALVSTGGALDHISLADIPIGSIGVSPGASISVDRQNSATTANSSSFQPFANTVDLGEVEALSIGNISITGLRAGQAGIGFTYPDGNDLVGPITVTGLLPGSATLGIGSITGVNATITNTAPINVTHGIGSINVFAINAPVNAANIGSLQVQQFGPGTVLTTTDVNGTLTLNTNTSNFFQVDAAGHVNFSDSVAFTGVINAQNGISGASAASFTDDIRIITGNLPTTGTLHSGTGALSAVNHAGIANVDIIGAGGQNTYVKNGNTYFTGNRGAFDGTLIADGGNIGNVTADNIHFATINALQGSVGNISASTVQSTTAGGGAPPGGNNAQAFYSAIGGTTVHAANSIGTVTGSDTASGGSGIYASNFTADTGSVGAVTGTGGAYNAIAPGNSYGIGFSTFRAGTTIASITGTTGGAGAGVNIGGYAIGNSTFVGSGGIGAITATAGSGGTGVFTSNFSAGTGGFTGLIKSTAGSPVTTPPTQKGAAFYASNFSTSASFSGITAKGDVVTTTFSAGFDFGPDALPASGDEVPGTAGGAAPTLGAVNVTGNVFSSQFAAGIDPQGGPFGDGNDTVINPSSVISTVNVSGFIVNSVFEAGGVFTSNLNLSGRFTGNVVRAFGPAGVGDLLITASVGANALAGFDAFSGNTIDSLDGNIGNIIVRNTSAGGGAAIGTDLDSSGYGGVNLVRAAGNIGDIVGITAGTGFVADGIRGITVNAGYAGANFTPLGGQQTVGNIIGAATSATGHDGIGGGVFVTATGDIATGTASAAAAGVIGGLPFGLTHSPTAAKPGIFGSTVGTGYGIFGRTGADTFSADTDHDGTGSVGAVTGIANDASLNNYSSGIGNITVNSGSAIGNIYGFTNSRGGNSNFSAGITGSTFNANAAGYALINGVGTIGTITGVSTSTNSTARSHVGISASGFYAGSGNGGNGTIGAITATGISTGSSYANTGAYGIYTTSFVAGSGNGGTIGKIGDVNVTATATTTNGNATATGIASTVNFLAAAGTVGGGGSVGGAGTLGNFTVTATATGTNTVEAYGLSGAIAAGGSGTGTGQIGTIAVNAFATSSNNTVNTAKAYGINKLTLDAANGGTTGTITGNISGYAKAKATATGSGNPDNATAKAYGINGGTFTAGTLAAGTGTFQNITGTAVVSANATGGTASSYGYGINGTTVNAGGSAGSSIGNISGIAGTGGNSGIPVMATGSTAVSHAYGLNGATFNVAPTGVITTGTIGSVTGSGYATANANGPTGTSIAHGYGAAGLTLTVAGGTGAASIGTIGTLTFNGSGIANATGTGAGVRARGYGWGLYQSTITAGANGTGTISNLATLQTTGYGKGNAPGGYTTAKGYGLYQSTINAGSGTVASSIGGAGINATGTAKAYGGTNANLARGYGFYQSTIGVSNTPTGNNGTLGAITGTGIATATDSGLTGSASATAMGSRSVNFYAAIGANPGAGTNGTIGAAIFSGTAKAYSANVGSTSTATGSAFGYGAENTNLHAGTNGTGVIGALTFTGNAYSSGYTSSTARGRGMTGGTAYAGDTGLSGSIGLTGTGITANATSKSTLIGKTGTANSDAYGITGAIFVAGAGALPPGPPPPTPYGGIGTINSTANAAATAPNVSGAAAGVATANAYGIDATTFTAGTNGTGKIAVGGITAMGTATATGSSTATATGAANAKGYGITGTTFTAGTNNTGNIAGTGGINATGNAKATASGNATATGYGINATNLSVATGPANALNARTATIGSITGNTTVGAYSTGATGTANAFGMGINSDNGTAFITAGSPVGAATTFVTPATVGNVTGNASVVSSTTGTTGTNAAYTRAVGLRLVDTGGYSINLGGGGTLGKLTGDVTKATAASAGTGDGATTIANVIAFGISGGTQFNAAGATHIDVGTSAGQSGTVGAISGTVDISSAAATGTGATLVKGTAYGLKGVYVYAGGTGGTGSIASGATVTGTVTNLVLSNTSATGTVGASGAPFTADATGMFDVGLYAGASSGAATTGNIIGNISGSATINATGASGGPGFAYGIQTSTFNSGVQGSGTIGDITGTVVVNTTAGTIAGGHGYGISVINVQAGNLDGTGANTGTIGNVSGTSTTSATATSYGIYRGTFLSAGGITSIAGKAIGATGGYGIYVSNFVADGGSIGNITASGGKYAVHNSNFSAFNNIGAILTGTAASTNGNVNGSRFVAGTSFGSDGALGGGDDVNLAAGGASITSATIHGAFRASDLIASVNPVDGIYGDSTTAAPNVATDDVNIGSGGTIGTVQIDVGTVDQTATGKVAQMHGIEAHILGPVTVGTGGGAVTFTDPANPAPGAGPTGEDGSITYVPATDDVRVRQL